MPQWMKELRQHMLTTLNLPLDNPPNAVNINWYKNNQGHIGAHSDDEELFGVDFPVLIVSFSLGVERPFEIWNFDADNRLRRLILPNGYR
eukprot:UN08270